MSYLTGNEAAQHLRGYIAQHLGLYDDEGVAQSKKVPSASAAIKL